MNNLKEHENTVNKQLSKLSDVDNFAKISKMCLVIVIFFPVTQLMKELLIKVHLYQFMRVKYCLNPTSFIISKNNIE